MGTTGNYEDILEIITKSKIGGIPGAGSDRMIYAYQPADKVGAKILKDFVKFYDKKAGSFPLDDKDYRQKFGLITHIMALSTFLELKSLGVDISQYDDIYFGLIEKVFACVYQGGEKVFDATPYWENADYKITTYVESASKVVSTIVDLRDVLLNALYEDGGAKLPVAVKICGDTVDDAAGLLRYSEKLIVDASAMLNDAALVNAEPFVYEIDGKKSGRTYVGSVVTHRGWAFQKPAEDDAAEYDTSLYYTYYGTNAFISVYNSMEDLYEELDNGTALFGDRDKNSLSDEDKKRYAKYLSDKKFYGANSEVLDTLRKITASAGRYIETKMKRNNVNISFDYVDKNLNPISVSAIGNSKNNHIMNSLFAFAILINAGVDDDYLSIGKSSIYQSIQFALTNIKKIYVDYKDKSREDLIENYSLGEDKCPDSVSHIMQNWRKKSTIAPYELVPLYCNTYNLIFNYIIKYPQKEMRDNLVWILENKSPDGWFWRKEGFSVNNNLYYIYAIDSFYLYYEKYEKELLDADVQRGKAKEKADELAAERIRYEKELRDREERYNVALNDALNKRSPLDTEVEKLAQSLFEKSFGEYFEKCFEEQFGYAVDYIVKALTCTSAEKETMKARLVTDRRLQSILFLSTLADATTSDKIKESIRGVSDEQQKNVLLARLSELFKF